jgi:hypothetical protein
MAQQATRATCSKNPVPSQNVHIQAAGGDEQIP